MGNYFKNKLILESLENKVNKGIEITDEEREVFRVLHKEIKNVEMNGDLLSYSVEKLKMTEKDRAECIDFIEFSFRQVNDDRLSPSLISDLIRTATIAFEGGVNFDKIENQIRSRINYRSKLRLNDSLLELIILEKGFSKLFRNILDTIYKIKNEITVDGVYSPIEKINFKQNRYTYSTIVHLTTKGDTNPVLSKQQLGRYSLRNENDFLYLRAFERLSKRHGTRFVLHDDFERFYLSFCAKKGIESIIDFEKLKTSTQHCYLIDEVQKESIDFEDGLTTVVKNI